MKNPTGTAGRRNEMKTTRTLIIVALGVLLTAPALLADVKIGAELRITPRPRQDLEVYVWPDRGMDGVYYPGERINVNVEVTRDAFLILYNIDTRGRLTILFPSSPWDDNFVEAGDVITFPRRWDEFDWTVEGPPGTEYIQAIASEIPISLPEWPIYMKRVNMPSHISPHPDMRDFKAGSDRYDYIDVVNRNLCGRYYDWCATDVATFHVRQYPRYHHVNDWDPWPDVFYGEIYISWPLGARIYVDNIYIGIAPCWVPRHYSGRRVITCYDGQRLIRRHEVNCFPKRDYYVNNRFHGSREFVYKKGRPDAYDHFRYERHGENGNRYRAYDRGNSRYDDVDDDAHWKSSTSRGSRNAADHEKQNVDRWLDYDMGKARVKSESKSAPVPVKTADRAQNLNSQGQTKVFHDDDQSKRSSKSGVNREELTTRTGKVKSAEKGSSGRIGKRQNGGK
jgi:hypothetical protein